ncbi:unnamed protein product [Mytilus coruscus]|uniref:Retrotransposon gag domain-containing protein n=1 Tax=Mytilus coruscus TaxID=42192 RepID=A0A6J8BTN6_MYTCO|nr:unnamed protein product [Mytilus coruscus]
METPRRTIRTSTQAPTLSQVRQNCFRNQLFSPADSGLVNSPATGTLNDIRTETMPEFRYRRRIGHCSPRNHHYRVVQEKSNTQAEDDSGNGWRKFWLIWISLLSLSSGLVAVAWIYFPNNRVVQKSQEYVMIGLLAIICLIISTIVLKFVWNSVISGYKAENTVYTWSRNRRSPNNMCNGLSRTPDNVITETESDSQENECTDIYGTTTEYPNSRSIRGRNVPPSNEYPVRRTFSGASNDVWNEFIQYFENLSELNVWDNEKSRRVLLSTLRGQAETYAYGMPLIIQRDYNRLKQKMEERFGHTAMKERYVTEAKLRKRQPEESLRDFGQAIEDLYRRAYPGNPEIVEENSIKAFLDKCGQSEEFRLAVKRTRPNTLQEAVINSMQEECLRAGEKDLVKEVKPVQRPIFEVGHGDSRENVATETEGTQRENVDKSNVPNYYPQNNGIGSQGWSYNRGRGRGRGRSPMFRNRSQNFRNQGGNRRDFGENDLN